MAQTAHQSGSSRRALRDLVPVTMATGLAGVIVALLVGGTTAGIRSVLGPDGGSGNLPNLAAGVAAGDPAAVDGAGADGISVRVRPSRPPVLSVESVFDLAAPLPSDTATVPLAVRGATFERTSTIGTVLPSAVSALAATAVTAPVPASPVAVVPAVAPSPAEREPRTKPRTKPRADDEATVRAASYATTATTDDRRVDHPKSKHEAPPDHAVANGLRRR